MPKSRLLREMSRRRLVESSRRLSVANFRFAGTSRNSIRPDDFRSGNFFPPCSHVFIAHLGKFVFGFYHVPSHFAKKKIVQRIYLSHLQMHHSMTHRRNSPVFLRWCRLSYPLALIHDSIISVESKAYCPCRTGPCPGNTVDQDVPAVSPAEKSAIVQILLSFCHPGALPSKFFPIQDVLQVDVLRRAHFLRACEYDHAK